MRRRLRLTGLMLWLLLVAGSTDAADAFRRWAVLSAPEVATTGLSDLLTSELSQRSFDLVEREQLAAITKEIELWKLLSPEGSSQRLKVGQLTKADALALLSLAEQDGKKSVKLVVCECRYGSRLKLEQFELATDRLDQVVTSLAAEIERTRMKFARGVEQIIAVSPFLSKSLTHEFDHLQFGLAGLLGQALSEQPGTAVLEIEEARTIGIELERAGGNIKDRVVPTLIEAEFVVPELARAVEASKVTLDVSVKASGGKTGTWKRDKLKLSEVATWLSGDVASGILKSAATKTKLSRDQQRLALLQRAENFTRQGAFPEAIALRESALLLHDPFSERLRLLTDYFHGSRLMQRLHSQAETKVMTRVEGQGYLKPTEASHKLRAIHEAAVFEHSRRCLQLIEGMIANREVNLVEGSLLWQHGMHLPIPVQHMPDPKATRHTLKQQFFWDNIPRLHRLDAKLRRGEPLDEVRRAVGATHILWGPNPAGQSKLWSRTAASLVTNISRTSLVGPTREELTQGLRNIERLATELHHPRWPIPSLVARAMPTKMGMAQIGFGSGDNLNYVTVHKLGEGELIAHYNRLIESKHPWGEFYGRCGLWGEAVRLKSKSKEEITAEFESLQKFLTTWRKKYPDSEELVADIDKIVTTIHAVHDKGFGEFIATKKRQEPASKEQMGKEPVKLVDSPTVKFEPIEGTPAPFEVITPSGEGLDAVWNGDHLWLMPVGGDLKQVFERPRLAVKYSRDFLHEVLFDGRWLWVVTAESGLRVIDLNGKLLGHLPARSSKGDSQDGDVLVADATQLPPFDPKPYPLFQDKNYPGSALRSAPSLRILPFGQGRCLVAGNYGPLHRLWIAVVTLEPTGSWDVKIIQQGTKVAQLGDLTQFQNTDIATEVTWLTLFQKPQPIPRPVAILGRRIAPFRTTEIQPLLIDLTSLKVSVLPGNFREDGYPWRPVVAANGRLIQNTIHLFESIAPDFLKPEAAWKSELFIASPNRDNRISVEGSLFVAGDDCFVAAYGGWARLNTREWKFDLLAPRPLPKENLFSYHGVSAQHGLVAWNRNGLLHRVTITEPSHGDPK